MPNTKTEAERRIHAAWRARACAASVSVGAQVFLFGAGLVMPISLNSAWIAAAAALPVSWLLCVLCLRAPVRRRMRSPVRAVLLSVFFLLSASFAAVSLLNLAEQSLLPQARSVWIAATTALFLLAASLSGSTGVSRLCFALRFFLPAALFLLSAVTLPTGSLSGLFPLLGAGALPLAASAACMCGAAAPALMLLLPPQEIGQDDGAAQALPGVSFFALRVLAGALVGALLLFLLCACSTYASIESSSTWGARLLIASSAKPHEGPSHALLIICQSLAVCLLCLSMLLAAADTLRLAFPRLRRQKWTSLLPVLALCLILLVLTRVGFSLALPAAPLIVLPAILAVVPLPGGRRAQKRKKEACSP